MLFLVARFVGCMRLRRQSTSLATALLLSLSVSPLVAAQEEGPTTGATGEVGAGVAAEEGRIIYGREYFAQFSVISADDLLRRIPGVQDLLDFDEGGERGFGSTGAQILINGQRLSGKSNDVQSALERIQARQVLRIEVISGNAPGLDVRSEGRVVNVVLEQDTATSYGSWEGSISHYSGNVWKPGGKASYAGSWQSLDYVLGLEASPHTTPKPRADIFFIPGMASFAGQRENSRNDGTDLVGTANFSYTFANGDALNVNGSIADKGRTGTDRGERFDLTPSGVETLTSTSFNQFLTSRTEWEVGGDYEHQFGSGDTLKLLFLISSDDQNIDRNFSTAPAGGPLTINRRQILEPKEEEKIARGTYRWGFAKGHRLTLGAEVAINTLDQRVQQFVDSGAGLLDVSVPNPDSHVEEIRVESVSEYSWQPLPTLSVEASVDTEYSRIKQTGSTIANQRTFFFVRPRLDVRYDLSPQWQVRAGVTRVISQLNFNDFVSSFRTEDSSDEVVVAGNPDLVPQKKWNYELVLEHRLADDQGVLTLRGFYNDIADYIHKIPVGTGNISAAGNVGSAKFYGAELKGGIRLDWLGLEGAKIDGGINVWGSSTTDAFTGAKIRLEQKENLNWNVSFRHDTSWHGLSYGVDVNDRSNFFLTESDFILQFWPKPNINPFVEFRPLGDIVVRLAANDLFRPKEPRTVEYFDGNRATANPTFTEIRDWKFGRSFTLSIRGTF